MKCDKCGNEATVHITEIRRGINTDRHLCEKCAETLLPLEESDYSEYLESLPPKHGTELETGRPPTKGEVEMTGLRQHVVVVDLRTGQMRPVGLIRGDSFSPLWSPDSRRLAMCHDIESRSAIVVVEPDKPGLRRFVGTAYSEAASWSRDSRRIAFSHADEGSAIVVADVVGGTAQRIAEAENVNDFAPAWSPAGDSIAFVGFAMDREDAASSSCSAFIADALSGERRSVRTLSGAFMMTPRWSSDAKHLAFASMPFTGADPDAILAAAEGQTLHVAASDAQDADATELRDDCQSFCWAPTLAGFGAGHALLALVTVRDEPTAELVAIDPVTRRSRSLSREVVFPAGEILAAHVSPDGRTIVAERTGRDSRIAFLDVVSGELREQDAHGEPAWLGWRPGGNSGVALVRTDAGVCLREMTPAGETRDIRIFSREEVYDAPTMALSPDGAKAAVEIQVTDEE